MCHDDAANHACAHTKATLVHQLLHPPLIQVLGSKSLCKVVTKVVGGARLKCALVPHHGLNGEGGLGPGKRLCLGLAPSDHGHGRHVHGKGLIQAHKAHGLVLCLLGGGMRRVALLPQELQGAHEGACAHLPAMHIAPLVHAHGQVTVALDPLGQHVVDDGLAGGAHHQRLFQVLATPLGHQRQLGRKAFHVVCLFSKERIGDQLREVGVLHALLFETSIEIGLNGLPDGISIRPDDHCASHGPIVSQFCLGHQFQVPLAEILAFGCDALLTGLPTAARFATAALTPILLLLLLLWLASCLQWGCGA
mmetsp:Transcript_4280/g.7071  ORF Transcript_4280/g.7071 Transcript_4280/m.7071 type:complete len:307 (+) Transcript_4280:1014-1934(+)